MTDLAAEAITAVLGQDNLLPPLITSGGEDFFYFTAYNPSIKTGFIGLCTGATPGLHHPDMSFHLNALENGVNIFKYIVKKLLS